ncbi:MAG: hypothetical protein RL088_3592 [Verrucomicrobiota bacterium]
MNTNICPTCKTSIPENSPGGFCPACVLRDADELPPIGRTAPSLDEVRAAFPQLEVLELIGQGGMGFVYKARQPSLDRTVALKILSPELGRDPAFAERFAREARVLGKLNHPNIVTVFEHGVAATPPSQNQPNAAPGIKFFYLIMEHVDGVNLRQAMRAGRFTPQQALAVVPGICDALQAAHAQGVWHRDIKPENILLDAQGGVKIVDFGIARIVGDPQRDFTLTMTGAALGSAAYMAPEQHEKPHDVDHRADIYSLGVVIYEMLTGELPLGRFKAPSTKAAVDARIDEIVFRTLEKERELRQQSADEVKTEVQGAASRKAPTSVAPSALKSPQLRFASKAALIGGIVLFTAAVVFTYGSTQGVLLAIAVTAFVLGGLGLLVGGVASSVVSPAAAAPVTVRSLWLFLGGIVGIVAGLIILDDAPYVPVHTSLQQMQPVLMPDPSALKLGKLLIALGGVAAFAGWCGLWYALSQMKRGAIPTTLRGFARTCAWLPIVLFLASSALWVKRRDGARQAQAEAALRVEEQQRASLLRQQSPSAPPLIPPPLSVPSTQPPARRTSAPPLPPASSQPTIPVHVQVESEEPVELIYKMNELANAKNRDEFRKFISARYLPYLPGFRPPSDEDLMSAFAGKIVGVWNDLPNRTPYEPRRDRVAGVREPRFALAAGPTANLGPAEKHYIAELERAEGNRDYYVLVFEWGKKSWGFSRLEILPYIAKMRVDFRPKEGDPKAILSGFTSDEQVTQVFANGEAVVGRFDIRSAYTRTADDAVKSANQIIERITANLQKAGSADAFKVVSPATAPEKPAFFSYPNISPVVRKPEQIEKASATPVAAPPEPALIPVPKEKQPAAPKSAAIADSRLQFRLVADADDAAAESVPDRDGSRKFRVHREVLLDGSAVAQAAVSATEAMPTVDVTFTGDGRKRFAEITGANVGKQLAIIFEGKVLSAPTLQSAITGGHAQITGHFTAEEAQAIASALVKPRESNPPTAPDPKDPPAKEPR